MGTVPSPEHKSLAISPSSTVHGGQYDTEYVTFEYPLHAGFVVDTIWGENLEPARGVVPGCCPT